MKKTLIILLSALVCLFLIVACGKSEPEETAASAEQQSVTDVERDEEELPTEGETPTEEPLAEQPSADAPAEEPEPAEEPAPAEPSEAPSGFEGIEVPADGVIRTAAELGKVLTDGDMAGNYKVEAAELDMTGIRYGSLGREDSPFSGTFDFGGCTLKGLYQPLFLYTNGATIDNLKIADTKIENDDELPEDMIRRYGDEKTARKALREQLRMHKLAMDGDPDEEEIRAHYDALPEDEKRKDYEPFNSMLKLIKKFDGLRIYKLN